MMNTSREPGVIVVGGGIGGLSAAVALSRSGLRVRVLERAGQFGEVGAGIVTVGDASWPVSPGDLFVVPSWQPFSARSEAGPGDSDSGALDLFRFSDVPVFEALQLNRAHREGVAR